MPGVTNDAAAKTVTVKVTDNGDGTLTAKKTADTSATEGNDFKFTNTYSVTPTEPTSPTDAALTLTKKLTGRDMVPDEFRFELVDAKGVVAATGTNDASGKVTLDKVTFDEPGEYVYTLREVDGGAGGIAYDVSRYTVTAKVTDNGDGTMGVTWSAWNAADAEETPVKDIVFKNVYEPKAVEVSLGATKVLEGAALADWRFRFTLFDEGGNVVETVANDANGQMAFSPLTFDEDGTYQYTIAEVNDGQQGVIYDTTVYEVTVAVMDNGEGSLVAKTTYNATPTFKNVVTPDGPGGGNNGSGGSDPNGGGNGGSEVALPVTGDGSFAAAALFACLAACAALVVALAARRVRGGSR